MDSSIFQEYATDLDSLVQGIVDKLEGSAVKLGGDERNAVFRRIERELEEADEIIAQMEVEVQTADHHEKASLGSKLREYKAKVNKQKADLKSKQATADREDLLSRPSAHTAVDMTSRSPSPGGGPNTSSPAYAQHTRLLSATDQLADGQRRLEESQRIALETEGLGTGILENLRGQRDTLTRTRDTLYEADGSVDRAANTIKKMVTRMHQQKAVTWAIVGVLVFLILYLLFSKLF
ncbi:v-SNARE domain-containing protein [Sporobolomyces salmoneus]|uniref:v-SNARE domain-containing protein n=1 Tax=Sporobolomyces salmoneus TaxID=183962 RepID=UPI0031782705